MKLLFVILITVFSTVTFAEECPNISGEFLSSEQDLLKIDQYKCNSVSLQYGKINDSGVKTYPQEYWDYDISGEPRCRLPGHRCTLVSIKDDFVVFETDYDGVVDGGAHGYCTFRSVARKLDSAKNLVNIYDAYDCTDGSQAKIERTFLKTAK